MVDSTNKRTVDSSKKSTFDSTNKSTVVRKKEKLKKDIVKEIEHSQTPLSTSDLSTKLEKAWHTIDRACLMLQIDGEIDGFKVGKMNLWRMK
ncbi:hypothetical protein GF336_05375 [Candidatus Woesearchaeota archaeon]|nr:hypothetical protein [Candidatus Woesearchaeota archaeon]